MTSVHHKNERVDGGMKMAAYYGLIRQSPRKIYCVVFPDFPDCVAAGRTPEEAWRLAENALLGHVRLMRTDGEHLPSPSSLRDLVNGQNRETVHDVFFVRI